MIMSYTRSGNRFSIGFHPSGLAGRGCIAESLKHPLYLKVPLRAFVVFKLQSLVSGVPYGNTFELNITPV